MNSYTISILLALIIARSIDDSVNSNHGIQLYLVHGFTSSLLENTFSRHHLISCS